MIRLSPGKEPPGRLMSRMADYARRIEAAGFPGIWVGDSMGRGRPTLDPLTALAALAAVTDRVELGVGVLQVSLRHPVELAIASNRCRRWRADAWCSGLAAARPATISSCWASIMTAAFEPSEPGLTRCVGSGAASRSTMARCRSGRDARAGHRS